MQPHSQPPASPGRRRIALALPLLGGVPWGGGAFAKAAGGAEARRGAWTLMGTRVDIVAEGPDAALLRHAMNQAVAEMRRLEALMSRYQPRSVVSRINLAAGIVPVAVPHEVMAVLQSAQRVSAQSHGAFDATVGALRSWDFRPGEGQSMPDARAIAREQRLVDARGLVLDARAGTAFLARQGMALDLGGIAKLPILQAGLRVLRAHGVENALVNGGGDVLAQGLWQGRAWRVGLRDPRAWSRLRATTSAVSSTRASASTMCSTRARGGLRPGCMA